MQKNTKPEELFGCLGKEIKFQKNIPQRFQGPSNSSGYRCTKHRRLLMPRLFISSCWTGTTWWFQQKGNIQSIASSRIRILKNADESGNRNKKSTWSLLSQRTKQKSCTFIFVIFVMDFSEFELVILPEAVKSTTRNRPFCYFSFNNMWSL